jgi:2,3-bisphosphoglycerate-independent phosphoglycerate mutase
MPTSGLGHMKALLRHAAGRAVVASLGGRYYGMDRDRRWERVRKWYEAAVMGRGPRTPDPIAAI